MNITLLVSQMFCPTDSNKNLDLLDFFIYKRISLKQVATEIICDRTSDHTHVLLTLNSRIIQKPRNEISPITTLIFFREELDRLVSSKMELKIYEVGELQVDILAERIHAAAKATTPAP